MKLQQFFSNPNNWHRGMGEGTDGKMHLFQAIYKLYETAEAYAVEKVVTKCASILFPKRGRSSPEYNYVINRFNEHKDTSHGDLMEVLKAAGV